MMMMFRWFFAGWVEWFVWYAKKRTSSIQNSEYFDFCNWFVAITTSCHDLTGESIIQQNHTLLPPELPLTALGFGTELLIPNDPTQRVEFASWLMWKQRQIYHFYITLALVSCLLSNYSFSFLILYGNYSFLRN